MTAEENRSIIEKVFHGLARSDASAFLAAMADDFVWVIEGQSRLSGRYEGKAAVETELLPPLFANFAGDFRTTADEIIVAGDRVVVLAHGEVTTVRGELYNNSYCFVIRMRDGQMVELREFMDTALAEARLTLEAQG
jgi:ketosteroid isomerase-like protein